MRVRPAVDEVADAEQPIACGVECQPIERVLEGREVAVDVAGDEIAPPPLAFGPWRAVAVSGQIGLLMSLEFRCVVIRGVPFTRSASSCANSRRAQAAWSASLTRRRGGCPWCP